MHIVVERRKETASESDGPSGQKLMRLRPPRRGRRPAARSRCLSPRWETCSW